VAYLTRTGGYDAGLVISASHNHYEDNGIKIFSGRGEKFTERVEREIETIVADSTWTPAGGSASLAPAPALLDQYLDHLSVVFPDPPAAGRPRLVIDCANGATSTAAPRLFDRLGFESVV